MAVGGIRPVDAGMEQAELGEMVHMIVVTNSSRRPVREVTCKIEAILGRQFGPAQEGRRPLRGAGPPRRDFGAQVCSTGARQHDACAQGRPPGWIRMGLDR
jgi:hypothetical protein